MIRTGFALDTFRRAFAEGRVAVSDIRGLVVWQRARETAVVVYQLTEHFPTSERAGLRSQMRRAAVSIMANIAEGNGRRYTREYCRYLYIAVGSLRELQSHLLLTRDLAFASAEACDRAFALTEQVRRMLRAMLRKLQPNGDAVAKGPVN